MGEVSARNMVDSIERSKGLGLRRALIGLAIPMASEGVAKRLCLAGYERIEDVADGDRRGAGGDPRHRPEGRRVASPRSSRGPRCGRRSPRCASHGVDLDVLDEDRPVDVAAAGDSPLKGKTVVITGAFTDPRSAAPRSAARTSRGWSSRRRPRPRRRSRASTDYLLAGENVGASKTAKAEKLGVTVVGQDELWAWLAEAGVT